MKGRSVLSVKTLFVMKTPFSLDFLRPEILSTGNHVRCVVEANISYITIEDIKSLLEHRQKLNSFISLPRLNDDEVLAIGFYLVEIDKFLAKYYAHLLK